MSHFIYIWKYHIDESFEGEFMNCYKPDGKWAQLFKKDGNYIKTELLRDHTDKNCFLTIDHWKSKFSRDEFRIKYQGEFTELDNSCEKFTREEILIGDFENIS